MGTKRTNSPLGVDMKGMGRVLTSLLICAGIASAQYAPPTEIKALLDKFRDYSSFTKAMATPETYGVNITTWQLSNGGFSKANETNYLNPWDGKAALSPWYNGTTPLGMFDNNATVIEVQFLSSLYKTTTNATNKAKFKTSVNKAIDFILTSQFASGAWPQVYPKRGNYSDMATYNDNAMVRVMVLVKDILDKKAPFDSDIIETAKLAPLKTALDKSVVFALKAQIKNGTKLTVWCQQHDPTTYAPVGARAYELPSKSGSESAGIIAFLMNWQNQTDSVQKAINGAIAWYKATKVSDMKWVAPDFVASPGSSMWYRFYNVENDQYFFSDRTGLKLFDITQVEMERRTGYQWGGDYGSKLLTAAAKYAPPEPPTAIRPIPAHLQLQGKLQRFDLLGRTKSF